MNATTRTLLAAARAQARERANSERVPCCVYLDMWEPKPRAYVRPVAEEMPKGCRRIETIYPEPVEPCSPSAPAPPRLRHAEAFRAMLAEAKILEAVLDRGNSRGTIHVP